MLTVGLAGNRLTATEQLLASSLNSQPKTINRLYTYDSIYRLTGESINGAPTSGTASYGYDPVGNRQSRSVTGLTMLPQTFSFDANDRLNTDTYDNNGNTLLGAGFGQTQADQYDFENHLVTRRTPTATITIKYDGDGNRVSKTITTATNTVTTCYLVDDLNPSGYAQVLEELTSINSSQPVLTTVYIYGQNLISQDRLEGSQWTASFFGYDGHNNVRYLTDPNGNVTDSYDYDAFGNLLAFTGSTPNVHLYSGEEFDLDLGLYYLRARYHNPNTGRFWTQDSFEGVASDPSTLHKYAYCGNNPLNCVDPSGHESLSEIAIATSIAACVVWSIWDDIWSDLHARPNWNAATCGPDVSNLVDNTLDDVTKKWNAAGFLNKYWMSHYQVFAPWAIAGGWDIDQLYNLNSQTDHPFDFGKGIQGTGAGALTVQFDDHVYYSGSVNYILWGHMFQLFHREYPFDRQYSLETAESLVGAYKSVISLPKSWGAVFPKSWGMGFCGLDSRAVLQALGFTAVGWDENYDASFVSLPIRSDPDNIATYPGNKFSWNFLSLSGNRYN